MLLPFRRRPQAFTAWTSVGGNLGNGGIPGIGGSGGFPGNNGTQGGAGANGLGPMTMPLTLPQ